MRPERGREWERGPEVNACQRKRPRGRPVGSDGGQPSELKVRRGGKMHIHVLPPSWEDAEEGAVCSGWGLVDLERDPSVREDGGGIWA